MGITGNRLSRNHGLDFLKGIAACMLVFVHITFPWPFGAFLSYVATFGVSVFFMTSGYFSYGSSRRKLLHSLKRIAIYLLAAYILYLLKMLIANGMDIRPVAQYLRDNVFTAEHLLKLPIFTQSAICSVVWFLITLLECYALKLLLGRWLRWLGYLGVLVGIVVVLPPIGDMMDFPLSNPWIWGVPCFVMGELVREHEERLHGVLSRRLLLCMCLVGITINLFSRYFGTQWWYIGNLLTAPALFLLFGGSGMKYNRFCLLGSTYAFFIYIVHQLVGFFFSLVCESPGTLGQWLRPLVVLAVTVLLAMLYYGFKSLIVAQIQHLGSRRS